MRFGLLNRVCRRRTLVVSAAVVAALLAGGLWRVPFRPTTPCQPKSIGHDVIEEFDIATCGDFPIVPVTIDGVGEFPFVVDTASSFSCVDTTLRSHVTQTRRTVRFNGRTDEKICSLGNAFLGKSRLPIPSDVLCFDFSGIRKASGHDVRGMLGMNFLRAYALRIDFDTGGLSILSAVPEPRGLAVPLSFDKTGCPTIEARVSRNVTVPFTPDTGLKGHTVCTLEKRTFDRLACDGMLTETRTGGHAMMIGGCEARREGRIDSLGIGPFELECVLVNDGPCNLLGLEYLSRYRITFDFPNKRLNLEPGLRVCQTPLNDRTGIRLVRVNGETIVRSIAKAGPAEIAGVAVGDCVRHVDHRFVHGERGISFETAAKLCAHLELDLVPRR